MINALNQKILLFDGVCNLCNSIVQFVIKRDKNHKFLYASLQSQSGQEILKEFNLPGNKFDTFILIENGKYYERSTAALKVSKELGGLWKWFYILIFIPKPIRDFFYSLIAKNRYKIFGKRETCMIPTPELKSRFLQ